MFYDRQGRPIYDEREWALAFGADFSKRVVDRTELFGGVLVSTVWLGFNHAWGDGPPLIFETMIFGGPLDGEQWRYSTEEQAMVGHWRVVALARKARLKAWFPTITRWLSSS